MKCYNCGIELIPSREAGRIKPIPDNAQTAEHIPAKTLFGGYSDEYKKNIITVNACRKCNNEYSKDDEEFRNAIGIMNEKDEKQKVLSESSVKSLLRKKALELGRLIFGNQREVKGVVFDEKTFLNVHKKNFRALFLHQYGAVLPTSFEIAVDLVDMEEKEFKNRAIVFDWLDKNFKWKHSGHPDIFKYIIQPFREMLPTDKEDIQPDDTDNYYLGAFIYHNRILTIMGATNVEELTKIVRSK